MFDKDFFSLRLFQLRAPNEWLPPNDGLCFAFFREGAGQYVSSSLVQRLTPGDILVWDAGSGGKLCPAKGMGADFWSFSVRLEHLIPLFGGNEISMLSQMAQSLKRSKLIAASSALAIHCHRLIGEVPPQFDLEHRSHLLRVAGTILNEEFKTAHRQRAGSGRLEKHIIEVFERLSVDDLLGLSVDELAVAFGCGRRHLNRLFHQYFGLSVGALRMEMRLQKAASLLRDGSAKVIHVAEQCGFNHLGLFNTCFKRRFGSSPGRWRKQLAQDELLAVSRDGSICPLESKGLCPLAGIVASASTPSRATASPNPGTSAVTNAEAPVHSAGRPPVRNRADQAPPFRP